MIVKFFDKTQTIVSSEEAEKIAAAINRGVVMIQIRGMMVNPKAIAMIVPGGATESDVAPAHLRLAAPDHRGKPSPALEKLRQKWGKHNVPPSLEETA